MIKQESKELLEGLRLTNYGKALKELLDEKYSEIGDIKTCNSWEEVVGRKYALKLIDEIFYFMKEKVDVTNKPRYD